MKVKGKELNWTFIEKVGRFVSDNGSTLSMVGGIVSLGISLYLAFKASQDVVDIHENYDSKIEEMKLRASEDDNLKPEIKNLKTERNIRYILAYKWVLLFGGTSAGLIFLTKYLDGLAISGLTAVAVSQQDRIKSLIERTKEVVGEEKYEEIEGKTFSDLVSQNFVKDGEPVVIKPRGGAGEIFIDTESGALFQMWRSDLEEAIQRAEDYFKRNHELSVDKFWNMIGLEAPTNSCGKMWGPKNPFKAHLGVRNTYHGLVVSTIEYDSIPQSAKNAGILKRAYK